MNLVIQALSQTITMLETSYAWKNRRAYLGEGEYWLVDKGTSAPVHTCTRLIPYLPGYRTTPWTVPTYDRRELNEVQNDPDEHGRRVLFNEIHASNQICVER